MAAEREPEYVDYREPSDGLEPFWLHLPRLRRRLAEHGLHLVTDVDLRVLEAVKLVPDTWLEMAVGSSQITRGLAPLAAAELARRGEKP